MRRECTKRKENKGKTNKGKASNGTYVIRKENYRVKMEQNGNKGAKVNPGYARKMSRGRTRP